MLVFLCRSLRHVLESTVRHVGLASEGGLSVLDQSFSYRVGRLVIWLVGRASDIILQRAHNTHKLDRFRLRCLDRFLIEWILSAQVALVDLLLLTLNLGLQKLYPLLN